MKRYTREEVDPRGFFGAELERLFGKRKTVSAINILDSDLIKHHKQIFIWNEDIKLWDSAGLIENTWDTFEANIREALK